MMGDQERAFRRGWCYVCMMCDVLGGTRCFQIEFSSEVVVPRKWIKRPSTSGQPVIENRI